MIVDGRQQISGSGTAAAQEGNPRSMHEVEHPKVVGLGLFKLLTRTGVEGDIEQQMRKVTLVEGAHSCQRRPSGWPSCEGLENGLGLTWTLTLAQEARHRKTLILRPLAIHNPSEIQALAHGTAGTHS